MADPTGLDSTDPIRDEAATLADEADYDYLTALAVVQARHGL